MEAALESLAAAAVRVATAARWATEGVVKDWEGGEGEAQVDSVCEDSACVDSVCEAYVCERRIVLVFHAPLRPFPSMQPLAPDGAHAVWYVRDAVLRREAAATRLALEVAVAKSSTI